MNRRTTNRGGTWAAALLTAVRFGVFAMRLALITRRLTRCRTAGFLPIVLASQLVSLLLPGVRVGAALLRAQLAAKRFGAGISSHLGPNNRRCLSLENIL